VKHRDRFYQYRRIYVRELKNGMCPTLTASMGLGGHNVPIIRDMKGIRKLTPRECARLQGFPESFMFPNDQALSHLYKQVGNSVTVPVISRIAENIRIALES
jgi:DNA (cytosine-5)-methyltransferase 1